MLSLKSFRPRVWMFTAFLTFLTLPLAFGDVPAVFVIGQDGHLYHAVAFKDPSTYLDGKRREPPENFTVRNKTSGPVVVCLYHHTDIARRLPFERIPLDAGASAEYPWQKVHVKVFKPAIFDKLKATKLNVEGNITITGTPDSPSVSAGKPVPVTIRNNGRETLKVCIYNKGDLVQAIPRKAWTLAPGKSACWNEAKAQYRIKLFRPALLDQPLVNQIQSDRTSFEINQSTFTRWTKVESRHGGGLGPSGIVSPIHVHPATRANGQGGRLYSVHGLDSHNRVRSLHFVWEDNRVFAAGGWSGSMSSGDSPSLIAPPAYFFDGNLNKAHQAGSDAVVFLNRGGAIQTRRLYDFGVLGTGAKRNQGPFQRVGTPTTRPFAIAGNQVPRLLSVDADGVLFISQFDPGISEYMPNEQVGSAVLDGVSCAANANGFTLAVVDTDHRLCFRAYHFGVGFRGWKTFPEPRVFGTPAVVGIRHAKGFLGLGSVEFTQFLFATDEGGEVQFIANTNDEKWHGWDRIYGGKRFRTDPVAIRLQ